jgi:hypothetical protein
MAGSAPSNLTPDGPLYCVNHPQTETLIRCSRCLDPICPKCSVRTAVGLRCKKCARINRSPLYLLEPQHYVLATVVAAILSVIAGAIIVQVGLLFAFFLSAPIGGIIAEGVVRSVGGKRGRAIQAITATCIVLGAFAGPWLLKAVLAGTLAVLPTNPLAYLASLLNLTSALYAFLAAGTAVARLR